jgi:hypothetical protein
MAKIYKSPIEPPVFNNKTWREDDKKYIEQLKNWCIKNTKKKDNYVGEIFFIPVADGRAMYMILNIFPLEMIHVNIGDGWDSQFANRVTKKEVTTQIKFNKLWRQKK